MSRIAVVSAAASGIGAAVVEKLASGGWRVIAVDLDEDKLAATSAEWAVAGSAVDERTWEQVRGILASVGTVERLGLVAGVGWAMFRASRDMTDDDWDLMFQTNFMSAVKPVRALLPSMEAAERGAIVTVGSLSGRRSEPTTPAYCAIKSALEAWTSVLALELVGTNVRVNCVLPGVTDTEGLRANLARKGQTLHDLSERARLQPRGSFLEPEEIAGVVAFLLSDDASGLVGASVLVDGGLSRRLPG